MKKSAKKGKAGAPAPAVAAVADKKRPFTFTGKTQGPSTSKTKNPVETAAGKSKSKNQNEAKATVKNPDAATANTKTQSGVTGKNKSQRESNQVEVEVISLSSRTANVAIVDLKAPVVPAASIKPEVRSPSPCSDFAEKKEKESQIDQEFEMIFKEQCGQINGNEDVQFAILFNEAYGSVSRDGDNEFDSLYQDLCGNRNASSPKPNINANDSPSHTKRSLTARMKMYSNIAGDGRAYSPSSLSPIKESSPETKSSQQIK